ncbi:MAG TPA: hypothetical protein VF660_11195 [Actinomycetota bacterium]
MAAVPFMLLFRFLHIVAGVLWVGSAFMFILFVGPTAGEVGPAAGPMLHGIVEKRNFAKIITALAITTVAAGWIMWLYNGLRVFASFGDFISSRFGLVLTIGGLLGTAALIGGAVGIGPKAERLVKLGGEIAAGGGVPSPEQGAEMGRLQAALKRNGQRDLILLILAVIAMATARYW